MPGITPESFTFQLGSEAALMPRTPAIAQDYQELLESNHERLARWFPEHDNSPTLGATRIELEERTKAWLEGSQLPLVIAVRTAETWRLGGAVTLLIDAPARSGEVGYWIDAEFEGCGLVTRAVTAVLDHAFGTIGLHRIELRTNPDNARSRSVARRLGFTEEGVLREAAAFPDEWRDEVVYGILAREWLEASH